ncbi:MAG: hypothetical protein ACR2J8_03460 [Thermomicrobiales bacterium]
MAPREPETPLMARQMSAGELPRYRRPEEPSGQTAPPGDPVGWGDVPAAIAAAPMTPGGRALVLGLLRTGTTRNFPGGGAGIEYGALLKTAAHPEDVAAHVQEAAAHLKERAIDLLLIPGMSGYPIGAMYSLASGIPALLLKKSKLTAAEAESFPPGAFVIPSYTGDGDVVMSADPAAVIDVVDRICERQLAAQPGPGPAKLVLRCAGADDIIDKATMSQAVGESAVVIGQTAMADWIARHRTTTGDQRPIETRVELAAWVTPLIKGYNNPQRHFREWFGIEPFAGVNVTGLRLDPPALAVDGVGWVSFRQ